MGTWTLGADNATVRNVPEPGPGPIQARRPIPQLSRINAIRFDGKSIYHGADAQGGAPARRQLRLQRQLHAVALERRCLEPGRDRVGSQRAAERAEHLRRDRRVGALELRPPPPVHRQRRLPAAVLRGRGRRCTKRVLGGWRANAIFIAQSGRAVHGEPRRRSRQHRRRPRAAARSAARSEPAGRRADAGALVRHVGVRAARRRSRSAARRATASSARATPTSTSRWPRRGALPGTSQLEFRWEIFNLFNRANFDLPNRIFGNPELRPDLQREEPARDAVRPALRVLTIPRSTLMELLRSKSNGIAYPYSCQAADHAGGDVRQRRSR